MAYSQVSILQTKAYIYIYACIYIYTSVVVYVDYTVN